MSAALVFGLSPECIGNIAVWRACRELGLRIGVPFRIAEENTGLTEGEVMIPCQPVPGPCVVGQGKAGTKIYGPRKAGGDIDCISGAAHLLSFAHEEDAPRDAMDRIDASHNPLALLGVLDEPLLEQMADHIFLTYLEDGREPAIRRRAFGEGKRVVSLTHDTDSPQLYTPFQLARALALAPKRADQRVTLLAGIKGIIQGRPDPFWNFEDWVELAAKAGGKSTIYVYPGKTADSPRHKRDPRYDPTRPRFREILKRLADSGTEIGLHHAINTDTVSGYRAASERMFEICGTPPTGCRAHYWKINWRDPHQSWSAMKQAGLTYDASLSPLDLGYRAGTSLPIFGGAPDQSGQALVVLPTSVMDWYALPRAPSEVPAALARLEKMLADGKRHGMVVLNWHIRTLTNLGAWAQLGDLARQTMTDLAADSDTRFVPASEIAALWQEHTTALDRTDPELARRSIS